MEGSISTKAPVWVKTLGGHNLSGVLARYGTVICLVSMVILFSVLRPESFATISNLVNILNQVAVLAIIAAGVTCCLVSTDFDFSVGSVASLSGVLSVGLIINQGLPPYGAIVIALFVGLAAGLANGLATAYLRVSSFVATMSSASIFAGVVLWYTEGKMLFGYEMPGEFDFIGKGYVLGIPVPVIVMAAFLLALWVLLTHLVTGRRLYAIGGNRRAAMLSGINVNRHRLVAFAMAGLAGALGGVLLSSRLGAAYPGAGEGFLLGAYAAAFLGSVSFRHGVFHIWGTLVGVLIIGVAFNGLTMMGLPPFFQVIFQGAVLLLAVALSGIVGRTGRI